MRTLFCAVLAASLGATADKPRDPGGWQTLKFGMSTAAATKALARMIHRRQLTCVPRNPSEAKYFKNDLCQRLEYGDGNVALAPHFMVDETGPFKMSINFVGFDRGRLWNIELELFRSSGPAARDGEDEAEDDPLLKTLKEKYGEGESNDDGCDWRIGATDISYRRYGVMLTLTYQDHQVKTTREARERAKASRPVDPAKL